jgi:hypothetical protein
MQTEARVTGWNCLWEDGEKVKLRLDTSLLDKGNDETCTVGEGGRGLVA